MEKIIIALVAYFLATLLLGTGNTVGLHRLLTHRSFKTSRPIRWILALLGAMSSGSPMAWVGLHRLHHVYTETEDDPHSTNKGFWWAHSGWLINSESVWLALPFALTGFGQQVYLLWHDVKRLAGRNPPEWRTLTKDLMKDPFMRFLDVPMVVPMLFVGQVAACYAVGGWWGILWLWAVHVIVTNAAWLVNSVCHTERFGTRAYETHEGSRNVGWLAFMTNGESYHNNHHRYPRSAKHALHGGFDMSWMIIRLLVALRLARDPWLPKNPDKHKLKAEPVEAAVS